MKSLPPLPGLVTERLRFREARDDDAAFMLRLVTDPDWVRFIGDSGVRDLEGARRYIDRALFPLYATGLGLWLVELRDTRVALGICGLVRRGGLEFPDLGFAFLPEHRGAGYAREASEAVIGLAREPLLLPKLLAVTQADNSRSIKLLERLGFAHEESRTLTPDGPLLELYAIALETPIPVFGKDRGGRSYRLRPGGYALFLRGPEELAVVRLSGGLYLPGGGQEPGESLEESAAREVREECGLAVRVGEQFFVADQLVLSESTAESVRKRCSFFRAELLGPCGPPTEDDHELCWMHPARAARELQHASQRHAVALAFGLDPDGNHPDGMHPDGKHPGGEGS